MEAIASPSLCRVSSSASSIVFGREQRGFASRLERCFLRTRRASDFGLSSSKFVQQSHPFSPVFCLTTKTQMELGEVKVQTEEKYQSQTKRVRVKFQLEKECLFGQQFLMVGDDPMFGLWDPENAVPLTWSDRHVWFAELDIPVGKSIHYKFILKDETGNILWQSGPDRVFQAWETKNIIVVSEDWENNEFCETTEEEQNSSPDHNLGMVIGTNGKTARDTIPPVVGKPKTRVVSSKSEVAKHVLAPGLPPLPGFSTGEDDCNKVGEKISLNDFSMEKPVLVPGLPPLPTGEDNYNKVGEKISLNDSVEAFKTKDKSLTEAQLDEKQEWPPKGKIDEMTGNEEQKLESELQQPNIGKTDKQFESQPEYDGDMLLNDLQWGPKTLQKFLNNFGIF